MNPAWWMDGVAFQCQPNCGKCCDQPGGYVYLAREDAERLAAHAQLSVDAWLERDARRTFDGRFVLKNKEETDICIHFNEQRQCDVYEVRPQQCRAFPWWPENLVTQGKWQKTKRSCPGIEAEDALIIDGQTIRFHLLADRIASQGFREWQGNK